MLTVLAARKYLVKHSLFLVLPALESALSFGLNANANR